MDLPHPKTITLLLLAGNFIPLLLFTSLKCWIYTFLCLVAAVQLVCIGASSLELGLAVEGYMAR